MTDYEEFLLRLEEEEQERTQFMTTVTSNITEEKTKEQAEDIAGSLFTEEKEDEIVSVFSSINSIVELFNEQEDEQYDDQKNIDAIFDFSLPQEVRLQALEAYYKEDPEQITEVVSKLMQIYCYSPIRLLQRFIADIAIHSTIERMIRIECAKTLCFHEQSEIIGYSALNVLCEDLVGLPAPYQFDCITFLYNKPDYKESSRSYLLSFISDQMMDAEYRYRSILSLEYRLKESSELICELCLSFVRNNDNSTKYRILACQNLLALDTLERDEIEEILISFAHDTRCYYQSDAADVLLHLGSRESIQKAQEVIDILSLSSLVYQNEQNVHLKSIEKGIIEIIQYLDTLELSPLPNFDFICKRLEEALEKDKESLEKVRISLTRIELDRTIFKDINHNLQTIFLRLWSYISRHEDRDELRKRMTEELIDMADTCTTGYLGRLVNVLSGFGECNLHISWEEQIVGNLTGRLNAKIRNLKEEDLIDEVFEDLKAESVEDLQDMIFSDMAKNAVLFERPAFMVFFRKYNSSIKEEMYQEFRDHIPDTDFDLYFREALISYEGYR